MHGQAGEAVVAAANMAALFSACFLVAVTQHTSSSHVIIGVGGGVEWKPMATNAGVEPCPLFFLPKQWSSRWPFQQPATALRAPRPSLLSPRGSFRVFFVCVEPVSRGLSPQ